MHVARSIEQPPTTRGPGRQDARELLGAALGAASVGLCLLDGELRVVWLNEAFGSLIGAAGDGAAGRPLDELPGPLDGLASAARAALAFAEPVRGVDAGGAVVDCLPVRDGGAVVGVAVVDSGDGRRAEDAARAADVRVRHLLENARLIAITLDPEGRIVFCNEHLTELTGWPREELLGRDWFATFDPPDMRGVRDGFRAAVAAGAVPAHTENYIVARSGERRLIRWSNTLDRDAAGRATGVTSIGEDVTLRRRAEQRLAAQLAVACALSEAGSLEAVAPRMLCALGEVLGWRVGVLWRVERRARRLRAAGFWADDGVDAGRFGEAVERLAPGRGEGLAGLAWQTRAVEWIPDLASDLRFLHAAEADVRGMRRAVAFPAVVGDEVVGVVEFLAEETSELDPGVGEIAAALGSQIGQVLKRREAALALEASESRKGAILRSALDCVIGMDDVGRIVEFNPAAERTFAIPAEQALGRELAETVIPPDQRAAHREGLARYLATGEAPVLNRRLELTAMRADGTLFPVEAAVSRIDEGDRPAFTAFLRDITDRKAAEAELRRQAEEQAALRRVAMLVAADAAEQRIFDSITEELGRLLDAHTANMVRYDGPDAATVVGGWTRGGARAFPVGSPVRLDGDTLAVRVRRAGAVQRIDGYEGIAGETARRMRELGLRSSVAAPVRVGGVVWGMVMVSMVEDDPLPAGSEERVARFADIASQALANADARRQLTASRARLVEAGDAERRRLERNLHDGAQQRLVSLSLALRLAEGAVRRDPGEAERLLVAAREELAHALEELRELARGIHPAILTQRGLAPALEALATRSPVPATIAVSGFERLPAPVEAAAYYLAAEGLTNVAKYARADSVAVRVAGDQGCVVVEVEDDGVGGASAAAGSGLQGLTDRIEALGGRFDVRSPVGGGTTLRAEIPLPS